MRISDWSSDVCSSDLVMADDGHRARRAVQRIADAAADAGHAVIRGHPHFGRGLARAEIARSEEHTSELQSLMRISYAVFCLKKKKTRKRKNRRNKIINTDEQLHNTQHTHHYRVRIMIRKC